MGDAADPVSHLRSAAHAMMQRCMLFLKENDTEIPVSRALVADFRYFDNEWKKLLPARENFPDRILAIPGQHLRYIFIARNAAVTGYVVLLPMNSGELLYTMHGSSYAMRGTDDYGRYCQIVESVSGHPEYVSQKAPTHGE